MLVIVVGVTGVGKSTVISRARDRDTCPSCTVVNYGDILLELAQERDLADDRDDLTDIPPEPYSALQEAVPRRIAAKATDDLLLLDTHAVLRTPTGYRPGLPQDTIDVLDPDAIAFVKAPASSIVARRETDASRDRDALSAAQLQQQQQAALRMASANAVLAGCPLDYIENPDGAVDAAATQLATTLDGL